MKSEVTHNGRKSQQKQQRLFEYGIPQEQVAPSASAQVEQTTEIPGVLLGTSSFTAKGWQGTFYPAGMKTPEFLTYYASQFRAVEIDSTFYGTPRASTVLAWKDKTPA